MLRLSLAVLFYFLKGLKFNSGEILSSSLSFGNNGLKVLCLLKIT